MKIPYTAINPDTLTRMIEELVTRAGTDYGQHEYSVKEKVAQVMARLESGEAEIFYDEQQELCEVVPVNTC